MAIPTEDFQLQKFIQTYQKSQVVFSEGAPGKEMYVIYSGKIKLCHQQDSGRQKVLAKLDAGDFFGEMALVDDCPRSATAIADEEDTQLIILDKKKFTYLLRHQPDFALVVMSRLCERLRRANEALLSKKGNHGSDKIKGNQSNSSPAP